MEYYGLDPRPDPDDISTMYPERKFLKTKYRELVRVHHPDKQGDTAEFQRIDAAYRELLGLYEEEDKGGKFKYPSSTKDKKADQKSKSPGHKSSKNNSSPSGGNSNGASGSPSQNIPEGFDPFGSATSSSQQAYTFDPFTGEKIPAPSQKFPETQRNYDEESSSVSDSENGAGKSNIPKSPGNSKDNREFRVVEVIIMGFRNLEKSGTYKIEVSSDGRSQSQRDWTVVRNRGVQHCARIENFTFFRWNERSYIQVILHGQRKFRLDKRAGEAHIPVGSLISSEHNGSYDGWVVLEHKAKHRGEVLLAIHMDGPEVIRPPKTKKSPAPTPPPSNPFANPNMLQDQRTLSDSPAAVYYQPQLLSAQQRQGSYSSSFGQLQNVPTSQPSSQTSSSTGGPYGAQHNPFAVTTFDPLRGGRQPGNNMVARDSSSLPGSPQPRGASMSPGQQPLSPQPIRGPNPYEQMSPMMLGQQNHPQQQNNRGSPSGHPGHPPQYGVFYQTR